MSLPGFRTRNPLRDHETDLARFNRLISLLERMDDDIAKERTGMQARYQATESSAAFAMESLENGDGADDDLTLALQRYHARIGMLDRQIAFMNAIGMEARAFRDALENEFEEKRAKDAVEFSRNVAMADHD